MRLRLPAVLLRRPTLLRLLALVLVRLTVRCLRRMRSSVRVVPLRHGRLVRRLLVLLGVVARALLMPRMRRLPTLLRQPLPQLTSVLRLCRRLTSVLLRRLRLTRRDGRLRLTRVIPRLLVRRLPRLLVQRLPRLLVRRLPLLV
jgi:hypothetical protein